jgi:hypothetical protein
MIADLRVTPFEMHCNAIAGYNVRNALIIVDIFFHGNKSG